MKQVRFSSGKLLVILTGFSQHLVSHRRRHRLPSTSPLLVKDHQPLRLQGLPRAQHLLRWRCSLFRPFSHVPSPLEP